MNIAKKTAWVHAFWGTFLSSVIIFLLLTAKGQPVLSFGEYMFALVALPLYVGVAGFFHGWMLGKFVYAK